MPPRNHAKATDAELLACFAAGRDQRAFAELVSRHGAMVRSVARRILRDAHDADDAFQAAFLALARSAARVRWKADVAGWLHQTAVRSARKVRAMNADWRRKKAGEKQRRATDTDYLTLVELEELRGAIDEELRELPTKYRTAIVLCDLEGLTRTEAAARTGSPISTLQLRLRRGRELLRARLIRRGFTFSTAALATYSLVSGEIGKATAQEDARNATRFTSQKMAAAAAHSKVAAAAQGVMQQMTISKVVSATSAASMALFLCVLASLAPESLVRAQVPFLDDFEDSSIFDGSPAIWIFNHGDHGMSATNVDGKLVLQSALPDQLAPNLAFDSESNSADLVIETELRVTELSGNEGFVGFFIRGEEATRGAYVAGVTTSGDLAIMRQRSDLSNDVFARVSMGFSPVDNDLLLRLEAVGPNLEFSATDLSTGRSRTVNATDSVLTEGGRFGLFQTPSIGGAVGGPASVEFSYLRVVPEPSSAALAGATSVGAGLWIAFLRRRRDAAR